MERALCRVMFVFVLVSVLFQAVPTEGRAITHTSEDAEAHARLMRPAHTTKLNPGNYAKWIRAAIKADKTAFVRFMVSDDTAHCSWVLQTGMNPLHWVHPAEEHHHEGGHSEHSTDEHENKYEKPFAGYEIGQEPPASHHTKQDAVSHDHRRLAEQHGLESEDIAHSDTAPGEKMEDHDCAYVQQQAKAWNAVSYKYGVEKQEAVFGDVVLTDFGQHRFEQEFGETAFGQDAASADGGCTIRHFNKATDYGLGDGFLHRHCADLVDELEGDFSKMEAFVQQSIHETLHHTELRRLLAPMPRDSTQK